MNQPVPGQSPASTIQSNFRPANAHRYCINLILAHQFTQQISDYVLAFLLGNAGSQIVIYSQAYDSELKNSQFADTVTAQILMNIPNYHAYNRRLAESMPGRQS